MCVCELFQTIEPVDVFWKCNKGYLNVPRSLPNGDVLIANVGDAAGNAKGTLPWSSSLSQWQVWKWSMGSFPRIPFLSARWIYLAGWTEL